MDVSARDLPTRRFVGAICAMACAVAAASVLLLAQKFGTTEAATRAAALAILAIGLWSTRVLPEHVTAIGFFLIAALVSEAPSGVIFLGFSSPAFWLTFGGMVIGVAIGNTGLGNRVARAISVRLRATYWRAVSGAAFIGVALAILMPSTMGRVVLLIPIISTLSEQLGFPKGGRGHTGMVLSAGFSTYMVSAGILPANLPNVILLGLSQSLYDLPITYGSYLLLHLPVTGLLKVVAIVILVCVMFPDTPSHNSKFDSPRKTSAAERWLMVILSLSILLWMSDFLHHISPAWVALGAAILCMLPYPGLVSAVAFNERINFAALFFVAAFLGLAAVIADSGLGTEIGLFIASKLGLEPGETPLNFVKLSILSTIICLVTTTAGVPAVLTPMATKLAAASGLPLMTVLMTQVFGFSTFLLPYQGAPLLVTMQLGRVRSQDAIKLCLALAVVSFLVLLPVNYLWWWLLGYFS